MQTYVSMTLEDKLQFLLCFVCEGTDRLLVKLIITELSAHADHSKVKCQNNAFTV